MVYSIITNENAVVVSNNINRSKTKTGILLDELSTGKKSILGGNVSDIIIGSGLKRAQSSLQAILDGIPQATGILNTATGALQQIGDLLNRQVTLANKSKSSSGDDIRAVLDDEFQTLAEEINRISNSTSFNGVKILNGNLDSKSALNSDVRLNEFTASLNIGDDALNGAGSIAFNRGNLASAGNFLTSAQLDLVLEDINNGIIATDFTITGNAATLVVNITLGGIAYTTTATDLGATKTLTLFNAAGGGAAGARPEITLNLKNNEFFAAVGIPDFRSRLAADFTEVVINQKKPNGGIFADNSGIGTQLLLAGTNALTVGVNTALGTGTGDPFLVGDLSGIRISGKYTTVNSVDISAVVNGKVYSVSAYDYSNALITNLALTNSETGTTITLTRDTTKLVNNVITDQPSLDAVLTKLRADVSGSKLYQNRNIGSGPLDQFKPKALDSTILGGLDGFSLKLTSSAFSLALDENAVPLNTTPTFEGFRVGAEDPATGEDGYIEVTINGEIFKTPLGYFNTKSTDLKSKFANPNGTAEITLVNERDPNETFVIDLYRAKSSGINIDTTASAQTLENALNLAFNTTRESKISFQVGLEKEDKIGIVVGRSGTDTIYKNADGQVRRLSVSTAAGADEAVDVLKLAIKKIDSTTGKVVAAYARFQAVENNLRTGIANSNAAAAPLNDTDFTSTAAELAAQQVIEQAGISALSKNIASLQNVLQLLR